MTYEWAKEMNCNITVCDTTGQIIFMNDRSLAKYGDITGQNLFDCHNPQSQQKIKDLLETGGSNSYTIEKNGRWRMIYQTAWMLDGVVAGLVEMAMDIPEELPHFVRK
ncbi:MAG: PAS domain-containing protein [Bacteroides sp.]|uniref:PAS domain-containing protein n=1 Tax=Bacteroides sp. TaxID=29523 RepID=UPI002FC85307